MWKIIYSILVYIALPFFVFFALFKKKLRKNIVERLFNSTKAHPIKDALWIHAASIGEAIIAETLINFLIKNKKDLDFNFLVTTNTFYTKDMLLKKFSKSIHVYSLPLDLGLAIKNFIDGSTFKALIIIETEIWPNLIWTAKKQGIPIIILNGRISDSTLSSYRKFSFFLRGVLSHIDMVIAQSEEHRRRYISIGMETQRVLTTGNIKYYRDIQGQAQLMGKDDIVTFGSIKEKEMEVVFNVIKRLRDGVPELKIYIAPRELHLISAMEYELGREYKIIRYSFIKAHLQEGQTLDADIVLVDTVGDLLNIYKKSRIAFVGGSLAPYGGQNILEPLFFGTPVLFGPFIENFKEIADLILEKKAGIMVKDNEELYENIRHLIGHPEIMKAMGERGMEIIDMHRGYMEKTVDTMLQIIR
ncbi:MAG: hypothetical protein N3D15_01870 [Syntrophorhabdaceae bacterium]|nr:hypothetical protein [Syntrophorhabdaceae bacterium]